MPKTTKRQQLQQILDEKIDRNNYWELVAKIYESFRSLDQAHELLRQFESDIENSSTKPEPDVLEQAGIFAYAQGQFSKAAGLLEQVKNRKESAHFLGRALAKMQYYDEALKALEEGRRGKDDFETDRLLVEVLCYQRDDEAAEEICKKHESSHSDNPDWMYCMGRVLETKGEHGKAMDFYEDAISTENEHQNSLFRLAFNCDLNGEDDRAIELYEKCASINPTSLGALMNLGILYEDRGDYEKAVYCYEKILAVDPSHKRARLFLKDADAAQHMTYDEGLRFEISQRNKVIDKSIESFDISSRCKHVIRKMNVKTLNDLTKISEAELMSFENFGESSLNELKDLMAKFGLSLKEETNRLSEANETNDNEATPDEG